MEPTPIRLIKPEHPTPIIHIGGGDLQIGLLTERHGLHFYEGLVQTFSVAQKKTHFYRCIHKNLQRDETGTYVQIRLSGAKPSQQCQKNRGAE